MSPLRPETRRTLRLFPANARYPGGCCSLHADRRGVENVDPKRLRTASKSDLAHLTRREGQARGPNGCIGGDQNRAELLVEHLQAAGDVDAVAERRQAARAPSPDPSKP